MSGFTFGSGNTGGANKGFTFGSNANSGGTSTGFGSGTTGTGNTGTGFGSGTTGTGGFGTGTTSTGGTGFGTGTTSTGTGFGTGGTTSTGGTGFGTGGTGTSGGTGFGTGASGGTGFSTTNNTGGTGFGTPNSTGGSGVGNTGQLGGTRFQMNQNNNQITTSNDEPKVYQEFKFSHIRNLDLKNKYLHLDEHLQKEDDAKRELSDQLGGPNSVIRHKSMHDEISNMNNLLSSVSKKFDVYIDSFKSLRSQINFIGEHLGRIASSYTQLMSNNSIDFQEFFMATEYYEHVLSDFFDRMSAYHRWIEDLTQFSLTDRSSELTPTMIKEMIQYAWGYAFELGSKISDMHSKVEIMKKIYLEYRKSYHNDKSNPFEQSSYRTGGLSSEDVFQSQNRVQNQTIQQQQFPQFPGTPQTGNTGSFAGNFTTGNTGGFGTPNSGGGFGTGNTGSTGGFSTGNTGGFGTPKTGGFGTGNTGGGFGSTQNTGFGTANTGGGGFGSGGGGFGSAPNTGSTGGFGTGNTGGFGTPKTGGFGTGNTGSTGFGTGNTGGSGAFTFGRR